MSPSALSDVAHQTRSAQTLGLRWVGMQGIALPVQLAGQPIAAQVDAGVSLDQAEARGIHMSRLYLALQGLGLTPLTPERLKALLTAFLHSHQGLSAQAFLRIRGQALFERPALVSALSGWKAYPFEIHSQLNADGLLQLRLKLEVAYSSTCPCSASLARQLIQQRFAEQFDGPQVDAAEVRAWLGRAEGIVATPHSQRSIAALSIALPADATEIPLLALLERAEHCLGTAVQTAVKRADEQAFALANGQNLMFCEDAARRLHQTLSQWADLRGFHIGVTHLESLHAHNAVAESAWNWPTDY